MLDEERIRKESELRKLKNLKEKEENFKFLSDERNFIWDKEFVNEDCKNYKKDLSRDRLELPPLCNHRNNQFPLLKPYLTLFDSSSYQFPKNEFKKKKDPILRFNSELTIKEVENDFHPNYDCDIYRRELEEQIRTKNRLLNEGKRDEFRLESYPFGCIKNNYQNHFRRPKIPLELGVLDEKVSFNKLIS